MRNFNLSFLLIFTFLITFNQEQAKAQWVTIPDLAFANYISSMGYSQCFNGNLMDTTCTAFQTLTQLNVYGGISNIEGIQYLKFLTDLYIDYGIDSLKALPPNLIYLKCMGGAGSKYIANLPQSLLMFNISNNSYMDSLPNLPSNLRYFNCSNNSLLDSIPPLPASLDTLICSGLYIQQIPALPPGLKYFDAHNTGPFILPTLPNTLTDMNISQCYISNLPNFPTSMIHFNCSFNGFTTLYTLLTIFNYIKLFL